MDFSSEFSTNYDNLDLIRQFTGYIERVTVCARIDYYRKQKPLDNEVSLSEILPAEEPSYDDVIPANRTAFEFEDDLHSMAFSRLTTLRKNILTLIFVERLSVQQTAEKLNISAKYVSQHKQRALKALRDQLMDEEAEKHGK